jgi:hypothetical protein
LHTVETADNYEAPKFTTVGIATVTVMVVSAWTALFPIVASNCKQTHVDESAFVDVKFAFLVSPVSRKDTKRLVPANGRVAPHGLIVYGNAAVHAAARYQIAKYVRDIRTLGPESIIGPGNLPAFILCGDADGEKRHSQGVNEEQD